MSNDRSSKQRFPDTYQEKFRAWAKGRPLIQTNHAITLEQAAEHLDEMTASLLAKNADIERLHARCAELEQANVGLATESERMRAALEHVANSGCPYETCVALAQSALSGEPIDPAASKDHDLARASNETAAKPTDSELYGSSELFRHIWVCPMGWIGDKMIYGPGYTLADMKPWLVKLRRLVGFEHPEGTPLEQPEKAGEKS